MPVGAIVGGILGLAGAKKSADAQKDAARTAAKAAEFHPYDIFGPFGSVTFGKSPGVDISGQFNDSWLGRILAQDPRFKNVGAGSPTDSVMVTPDEATSLQRGLLSQLAIDRLQGSSPTAGFQNFSNVLGNEGIPGLFMGALDASSSSIPSDAFGNFTNSMDLLSGIAGGRAANLLGGNNPLANALVGRGLGAIDQDVSGLVNDRLNLLREQAAPQEERAFNSLQQRLFSQGRLGSTGGSRDIEAFARGLGQADLGRQLASQDLGMALRNQNLNLGQGLLSQAAGLRGQDLSAGQGLLGLSGTLAQNRYTGAVNFSDIVNSRAQQRLANAQSLFGFGNELGTQDYNQALSALGGQQSIDTALRNLIALGGNIGGQQAAAGANAAQAILSNSGSPTGAFLSSLGTGLFASALNPDNQSQHNPSFNDLVFG